MRHRFSSIAVLFVTVALLAAHGQWLNYPAPGTPRTRDGKPNLLAKAPRTSSGKPDLSGVWQPEYSAPGEISRIFGGELKNFAVLGDDPTEFPKYFLNILVDIKPEDSPLRPEFAALFRNNAEHKGTASPVVQCLPQGLPRADLTNYAPFKMIQTPEEIVVLYEVDNTYRQIHLDGRKLPADPQPSWLGYSVGKWEGDTLVVSSIGFNDKSWLDVAGHPHSEDMRVEERFHRRDFGHTDLGITVDDPKMYTRPISFKITEVLVPDSDVLESVCNENEKDRAHIAKP
jgi:hypothetical protein